MIRFRCIICLFLSFFDEFMQCLNHFHRLSLDLGWMLFKDSSLLKFCFTDVYWLWSDAIQVPFHLRSFVCRIALKRPWSWSFYIVSKQNVCILRQRKMSDPICFIAQSFKIKTCQKTERISFVQFYFLKPLIYISRYSPLYWVLYNRYLAMKWKCWLNYQVLRLLLGNRNYFSAMGSAVSSLS